MICLHTFKSSFKRLTFQNGAQLAESPDGSPPGVLAHSELHVEEGYPAQEEHHEVGDQEGASPGLVGKVGEPPDVAQTHGVSDTGQDEGDSRAPCLSLLGHGEM